LSTAVSAHEQFVLVQRKYLYGDICDDNSNVVGRINEVSQRRAWLVLGWVTICRQVNHLGMWPPPRSTQPGHPSVGRCNEYQRKLGRRQAHRAMHWPCIRGLAV